MLFIDQRIILVTRKTRQDDLKAKYGTVGQAKFYVARAHMAQAVRAAGATAKARGISKKDLGAKLYDVEQEAQVAALHDMAVVEKESRTYEQIISELRTQLDFDIPVQVVDRSVVPTLTFGKKDVIVAVGQDGLVANVAKYAVGLPIIGVNPAPDQYDGVLLPFQWREARAAVQRTLEGRSKIRQVTLAQAALNDGQRLLAFNDLFIGAKTHVSARYKLQAAGKTERQSSSGVLIATGAGSTGWLSSTLNMARGLMHTKPADADLTMRMNWEDRRLQFVVREPFASRTTQANLVTGTLRESDQLIIESLMGPEGTIFSDGVEGDALPFAEGAIATISVAPESSNLVVG